MIAVFVSPLLQRPTLWDAEDDKKEKELTDPLQEDRVRGLIYFMEDVIRNMNEGITKYTWIIDMDKKLSSLVSIKRRAQNKAISTTFNDHYPENLGFAFILHPPKIFSAAWKVLKPFLDPETLTKIHFVGKKEYKIIHEFIPPNQLSKEYGGELEITFDPNAYIEELRARALVQ